MKIFLFSDGGVHAVVSCEYFLSASTPFSRFPFSLSIDGIVLGVDNIEHVFDRFRLFLSFSRITFN